MDKKRKDVQDFILKYVNKIAPGGYNQELYEDLFNKMSDKQFKEFMLKLKNKELTISIIAPVSGSVKLDTKRNFKIGRELGHEFFQPLVIGPKGNKADGTYIPKFKTPLKYLVFDLPIRRTAQLLMKGISVGTDNNVIDLTTGQVTGDSKSSKLTKPELELLVGMGLNKSILELMKIRGGDLGSARAADASIARTGMVSQDAIEPYATGVVSTKTLNTMFNAAHLTTTLNK